MRRRKALSGVTGMRLGMSLTAGLWGSVVALAVGQTLTALPLAPTARYHPAFSATTLSAGRVVSASDLMGLAAATEGAAGIGPKQQTDLRGFKYWRFEGTEFMNIATTLAGMSNRACAVFMVGRVHRANPATNNIFGLGNVAAVTAVNTANAEMTSAVLTSSAPYLRSHGAAGSADASNKQHLVCGSQLQVLGTVSRTTALGGVRLMINERASIDLAQASIAAVGVNGAEIGRYPFSPGVSGNWGSFDLYELVVYNQSLTNVEAAAIQTALMTNYSVQPVVNQLVLEGDSITQGVGVTTPGVCAAMVISEPGAGRIPSNWRVVNMGTSGNQVANLVIKRDAVNTWADAKVAGKNVVAVQIGRNDFGAGAKTAAQHYAAVVAYLNTATTGVLQRGWVVRNLANIASTGGLQAEIVLYRAAMRDPQFLIDTGTQVGGAFAGNLSVVSTDSIQVDGLTIFEDAADAANALYYDGDATHPSVLGTAHMASGGSTPAFGIASGLTA